MAHERRDTCSIRIHEVGGLKLRHALIAGVFLGLLRGGNAAAEPDGISAIQAGLCGSQVSAAERAAGLPHGLLTAVSLVEAGRWDPDRAATKAWPWTVTTGGVGKFYPTKAAAAAAVRDHLTRGVRNIDVGCMQVNLGYHGDAFATVEEALDPVANIAYAVSFLTRLHKDTKSWASAVGRYHSAKPVHSRPYTAKVMRAWRQVRQQDAMARRSATVSGEVRAIAGPIGSPDAEPSEREVQEPQRVDIKERRARFAALLAERLLRKSRRSAEDG